MAENSKTAAENKADLRRWLVAFAAIAIVILYFSGLGIPLVGPDEPRYAQVAREMFERSDWITPTLGGYNWFEKPALLYWVQIASYHIFGVSEFSARFGSALFGLGTIVALWIIARWSETNGERARFANWTALIAASTLGIIVFSRGASFDIILTFPITAALAGFFVYERSVTDIHRYASLAAFYFFIGVAVLAKGLVGFVFPIATVALYYALTLTVPKRAFIFSLIWGTTLAVAVAGLWYGPMYQRHGYAFIDEFFIQHHFQRFTSNKFFHPQPFYFFLWVLPLMLIPWLPFFVAAVWTWIRTALANREAQAEGGSDNRLRIFAAAWIAVPLVFFSFSGSKLPGYILPAVPGALLLTSDFIFQYIRENRNRERSVFALAFATFGAVVLALIFAVPQFADTDTVKHLIATADERGFREASVIGLHTTSHNAEFYAAGRLPRTDDGRQKRLLGPAEVLAEVRERNGQPVLVLVPLEYLDQLRNADFLDVKVIRDNGELAIAAVAEK